MDYRLFAALFAATVTTAANAEPIDPCSLLSAADLAELGVPVGVVPSHEDQAGGVQYCRYQVPSTPTSTSAVSVILSATAPDRVLQVRALLTKALAENTPAQLEARGEYLAGEVMCKVVSGPQLETDQCLGTTQQSVVGLTLSHPNAENKIRYPAS